MQIILLFAIIYLLTNLMLLLEVNLTSTFFRKH